MKTIEEIMKLVDAYGDACETFGDYQVHANAMECVAAKAAIESSLRELVERKPLSEDQVEFLKHVHANNAYVGGDFEAGVRYGERAHGIGA